MFTLSDIREIAVKIERNGEAAYRAAGRNAGDPEIARLLEMMADQEKEHACWFEQLALLDDREPQDPHIAEMGRELLRSIMDQQTFSLDEDRLAEADTIYDLLRQSREFENDTILFYELLRDFLDDPRTVMHLDRIIAEEREHCEQLEKMVLAFEQTKR